MSKTNPIKKTSVEELVYQKCPICDESRGPINAHYIASVYSVVLFTQFRKDPVIGCGSCVRRKALKKLGYSMLAGWWGFPWGLIYTPWAIGVNLRALIKAGSPRPTMLFSRMLIRASHQDD